MKSQPQMKTAEAADAAVMDKAKLLEKVKRSIRPHQEEKPVSRKAADEPARMQMNCCR